MTDDLHSTAFEASSFLQSMTSGPGVYRMLGDGGQVLYVGKARNLRKRLASYFQPGLQARKTQALMAMTRTVEVTVTHTENEALILENTQIKEFSPRYNILLRDDKSYPYIYLSCDDEFPRLSMHRGAKKAPGRYFGPYPSAGAVRESLHSLQKLFPVRQCEDAFFRNRTRPCLQYQIKRCSAPCVGLVSREEYREEVHNSELFLEGKSNEVIDALAARMDVSAKAMDYERAAHYRDQIANLRHIQERQYVSADGGNLDIVAVAARAGVACVQVFYVRAGHNLGNKSFYPSGTEDSNLAEILSAFLPQYYLGREPPRQILISQTLPDQALLEQVLTAEAGHKVSIIDHVKGLRARWLEMAVNNAEQALTTYLASKTSMRQRFEALQATLHLDEVPLRLECFDISHTQGEATVASCVVFDSGGPLKSAYRRFNIEGIQPGDDYAALYQALNRHFLRLKQGEGELPDVLFIDGGKGQIAQAHKVLEELQVEGICLVGIAKGPARKAGMETLFLSIHGVPTILPAQGPALHLIQQIRDEAHRFAISGHRRQRARARTTSVLEDIAGLGPKRRQQLLRQFGGLREVARAGVEDLARTKGISHKLARQIYDVFHSEGR